MNDRDLVRLYWPVELRPAFDALFAIDDAMAEVVGTATQPALAAVKLAWWRDSLERLDTAPAPAEPRLRAAAEHLLPRGVGGEDIAGLEAGWASLLDETPDEERLHDRGALLFALLARIPGHERAEVEEAGRLWAAVDLARRFGRRLPDEPVRLTSVPELRPLTALAALAARDIRRGLPLEPEATPGRALALIRHRFSGR